MSAKRITHDEAVGILRDHGADPSASGYFRCPIHDDDAPSAKITAKDDGSFLAHCYACGDDPEWFAEFLAWLRDPQQLPDAAPTSKRSGSGGSAHGTPTATYTYTCSKTGKQYRKVRYEDGKRKSFIWYRPFSSEVPWVPGLDGKPQSDFLPYGSADAPGPVFWVEGEKGVDLLLSLKFSALTSGGGAAGALPDDMNACTGRVVGIVADRDEAGMKYAMKVAERLAGVAASTKIVVTPIDKKGADIVDHLEAGLGLEALIAAPVAPVAPDAPVPPDRCPTILRNWFARFICPMSDLDLDLLVLWALHTHWIDVLFTTPRLLLTSPVPGAGKTTVLEHLQRVGFDAVNMSSISSPALLTRMLDQRMRTILIDEVDRSLRSDKPGVEDLLAIINTGYKRGGTRPVLVPDKGGKWVVEEHSTFSPLVMAGRSPILPDDTLSRAIVVTLLPDFHDRIEDSDWELIEDEAGEVVAEIASWKVAVEESMRAKNGPTQLPATLKGRGKEKWRPLMKVAIACGGRWPDACEQLIAREVAEQEIEKESNLMTEVPSVALVRDIYESWPAGRTFWATTDMVARLKVEQPDRWGASDRYPKGLTVQRLGRMLSKNVRIHSARQDREGPRGYFLSTITPAADRLGLVPDPDASGPSDPSGETGATGATGGTGADSQPAGETLPPCAKCRQPNPYKYGTGGSPLCPACKAKKEAAA